MTVKGQFVGFTGRSVGTVIGGDGTPAAPWRFEFQSSSGGSTVVEVLEDSDVFFEYLPGLPPVGSDFTPAGGDLVAFRPCEAKFQGFPTVDPTEGVEINTWLIFGWVTYTLHWEGSVFPDVTPYAVLVDPKQAGAYVLANYQELKKLA